MAKIMEAFATELDEFTARYEDEKWEVEFRGETYPPRIIMKQTVPPLYKTMADGTSAVEENPVVQIIGRPEVQVVTAGKLQISKKSLNKMVNGGAALLELFLHGFMQERKEMEDAAH